VIADDDVKRNAADEGGASLVGVHAAVPDWKRVVAIAALGAIVKDIVAAPLSFVVAGLEPGSFSCHSSLATSHFLGSSASHQLQ